MGTAVVGEQRAMAKKDKRTPIVYIRGDFVPAHKAHVAICDLGIVLGATVTEMTRTFNREPFRLDDHIARLYRSLKYCRFDVGFGPDKMREIAMRVIEHNAALLPEDGELGIVHFVTAGENWVYAGAAGGATELTPTVCVHSFPLPLYFWKKAVTRGARVVTPSTRHVPPVCLEPNMKYRSRLHWHLADHETHLADPEATSLLLDLDGNITECSGANFLLVKDGAVYSPTPRNILLGISRQTVIDLCAELGIPFVERDLKVYDVMTADEAMLTTTPFCIAPVTHINGVEIADGKPGPLTKGLTAAWSELVGLDIVKQIRRSKKPK